MTIRISHVAIYCNNLEKSKDFYVKYFGAACNDKYTNTKGFSSYFLSFDDGTRLELMAHTQLAERDFTDITTGLNHIAFSVSGKENVIQLTDRITTDGYKLVCGPRITGDGYFESVVSDPDGNKIEITA